MAAVGPDSLPTATAMPSMSAFVTESRGSEHIGSVASSYISEGIFRKGGSTVSEMGGSQGCGVLICNMQRGGRIAQSDE